MISTVETGKFSMDYCRFGSGEKVFVIIPGLSTHKLSPMEPAVSARYAALADDYTVYLFDRRNELPDSYSTEGMAEDTALAMKQLGLGNVCLCSSSQGGMIAQVMAAEHPELVESLVLASTASRPNDTGLSVIGEWLGLARRGYGERLKSDMIEKVFSKRFYEKYAELIRASIVPMSEDELKRFITLAEPVMSFDFYDRLNEIKCRTFVVGSAGDRVLTGQASVEIAEKLGCRLYMYGNEYGHAAYDEAPDFIARVYDFLNEK